MKAPPAVLRNHGPRMVDSLSRHSFKFTDATGNYFLVQKVNTSPMTLDHPSPKFKKVLSNQFLFRGLYK